jgi:hypothetical protein
VTRRLEGVLDITSAGSHADPLLAPFLTRAADDIEQRLLDQAKASERVLLTAFQAVSRQRRAIAAIGDDMVLTNRAALDLLGPPDYAVLRMLAEEASARPRTLDIAVSSGTRVRIDFALVPGAGTGTLFHLDPIGDRPPVSEATPGAPPITAASARPDPVLVTGERGTGRSTEARRPARAEEVEFHNCADIACSGEQPWVRTLSGDNHCAGQELTSGSPSAKTGPPGRYSPQSRRLMIFPVSPRGSASRKVTSRGTENLLRRLRT